MRTRCDQKTKAIFCHISFALDLPNHQADRRVYLPQGTFNRQTGKSLCSMQAIQFSHGTLVVLLRNQYAINELDIFDV